MARTFISFSPTLSTRKFRDTEFRHSGLMLGRRDDIGLATPFGHPFSSLLLADQFSQFAAFIINATVVSSIRFEKPHSLSYHATTLTSRPSMTRVSLES